VPTAIPAVVAQAVAVGLLCQVGDPSGWTALLSVPVLAALWQWRTLPASHSPPPASSGDADASLPVAAVEAETDLGVFLETVNHELRTPLNAILGFSDLLLQEIDGPLSEDRRQNLEVIRDSGGTLLSLFDDVTELTALMGGQVPRGEVDTGLDQLVRTAVPVMSGEVDLSVVGARFVLVGDRARLERAVGEVLGLAVARAQGGRPRATLRSDERRVCLDVEVPCKPPAADELATLAMPSPSPVARQRGGGMGPAIAAHVALLHGGELLATATPTGLSLELSLAREAA